MVGKCLGAPFPKPEEKTEAPAAVSYAFGQRGGYGYGFEQPEPCLGCRNTQYRSRVGDTDVLDVGGAFLLGSML